MVDPDYPDGYDRDGYDRDGYLLGYDRNGYDRDGINQQGYDRLGNYRGKRRVLFGETIYEKEQAI